MTFQTLKDDTNNRGKRLSEALKNELCSIWLGMKDSNRSIYSFELQLHIE